MHRTSFHSWFWTPKENTPFHWIKWQIVCYRVNWNIYLTFCKNQRKIDTFVKMLHTNILHCVAFIKYKCNYLRLRFKVIKFLMASKSCSCNQISTQYLTIKWYMELWNHNQNFKLSLHIESDSVFVSVCGSI